MHDTTKKKIEFIVQVIYVAIVLLLCYIGLRIAVLVWPFFLALLLVACINPLVQLIYRKLKINQQVTSVIILVALYSGVAFLIFAVCTKIIFGIKEVFRQLPIYYEETLKPALDNFAGWTEGWLVNIPIEQLQNIESIGNSISNALTNFISSISDYGIAFVTDLIGGIPGLLISIAFAILLSFFISLEYDKMMGFFRTQFPDKIISKTDELKMLCKDTIFKYIKAWMILMVCTFVELSIGFFVIGISNPIGKAAGIAIFDALPVFGTGGIMIPWIIIELFQMNYKISFSLAILYIIVTVIRNMIEPKVVGDQLGLNPVVSLISIYMGYRLLGVMGMILFPILAQILLTLHQNGTIQLYKERNKKQE